MTMSALDCSSSLNSDFSDMKNYANNFISLIADNTFNSFDSFERPFGQQVIWRACPDNNHPHVIDMGSAGKWACCNVGASAPWEFGGYYAWGETEEKKYYSMSTYKYYDDSNESYLNIGSDIAGTQYDVAHVKWGGKWSMPSQNQIKLLETCSSNWFELKGVYGRIFTASNGNSIFLPAARYRQDDGSTYVGRNGYYWSSTHRGGSNNDANCLYFRSGLNSFWANQFRYHGLSVRPITE